MMLMFIVKRFRFPDAAPAAKVRHRRNQEDRHMTPRSLPASPTPAIRTRGLHGAAWLDWLRRALHAVESRRQLAEMDERMLADIGISRADALEEAGRAPWDLTPRGRR
jgi:uncharacterized protein YjiS (DUF1127 family)